MVLSSDPNYFGFGHLLLLLPRDGEAIRYADLKMQAMCHHSI
jgi:hypothetical protein